MTKISASDIRHLASLSGLNLVGEEVEALRADVEKIIDYINKLDDLDVLGVEPTYQVTDLENVSRDDKVNQSLTREELLSLAPEQKNHQIKVPKVL